MLRQVTSRPLALTSVLTRATRHKFDLMVKLLIVPFLFPVPPKFAAVLKSTYLLLSIRVVVNHHAP